MCEIQSFSRARVLSSQPACNGVSDCDHARALRELGNARRLRFLESKIVLTRFFNLQLLFMTAHHALRAATSVRATGRPAFGERALWRESCGEALCLDGGPSLLRKCACQRGFLSASEKSERGIIQSIYFK